MYLLVTPSPYSGEDLVNYKSMDCYINFLSGWVRVRVSEKGEKNNNSIMTLILSQQFDQLIIRIII